ncbi:adenylate/guanylate cyclase domain-containing protein [Sulfitobacter sabulilitoris]|uniref:Adenylate/guanylate cyclase domain-containing protein n=1 Tax=Sulfitobacter sabulilitoris TaxID=2562655 RepID=A0A5S3PMN1_9RHOB|nr:adenylate/guanylate cyclase domain-containing protein [Sulfitobacter sabulilitoris]
MADWVIQQGLDGTEVADLLEGYCERLIGLGVPLFRLHIALRAYHPEIGGLGFNWVRDASVGRDQFAHTATPVAQWVQSPLYHLLESDCAELRERLCDHPAPSRFPFLEDLRARGATDYLAAKITFTKRTGSLAVDPNDPPEGFLISWATDAPAGFSDADLAVLRDATPPLALALKTSSSRQMAHDLLATYLGQDVGNRVLSGDIRRGSCEVINAVICCFDLQGFTKLAERLPGPQIIDLLNDYFDVAVSVIEAHGGQVLKFMGDGLLAIFNLDADKDAAAKAVAAAARLRDDISALSAARTARGAATTGFHLGLHAGDVLYGNVGGPNRLDFTVIGPAVNTAARITAMSNMVDEHMVLSAPVADAVRPLRDDIVSLGQYKLRGVAARQELFTLVQDRDT